MLLSARGTRKRLLVLRLYNVLYFECALAIFVFFYVMKLEYHFFLEFLFCFLLSLKLNIIMLHSIPLSPEP